jgi:hypothetical protein
MDGRIGRIAGALLGAGGTAWLAKLVVISVTDGKVVDSGPASLFFVLGLALLVAGAATAGVALTSGRPAALRVAAAVLAPVAFLALFMTVLEGAGRALLATEGTWWYEEVGVFLGGCLGLLAGGALLLRGRRRQPTAASA